MRACPTGPHARGRADRARPGGPQAAPAARSALHDGVRPGQNL